MTRENPFRSGLRRLLSFPLLRSKKLRENASPTESEILFELSGENPKNLLFGKLDEEAIRRRLSAAGLMEGLARLGYRDPILALECEDPSDQRIRLFAGEASRERLLLEARLELRVYALGKPTGPFGEGASFRMMTIHWLSLSDPERPFSPARPRLPGQQKPGLGLLAESLSLLKTLGKEFSLDGVLDVPDHFHTALFYSRAFRFLEPEREGRFLAIARDLKGVPIALASEAISMGCLVDSASSMPARWEPAEQVMSLRGDLRRYMQSSAYRSARDRSFSMSGFAVDWDLYRMKVARSGREGKYP
jgi:hypothetical protein